MNRLKAYRTLTLVLCLLALSFSGCGAGTDQSDTVTITFWHSFVASTIPALEELLDRFEEEHPGIRVRAQYIPTGDALVQKLITSIQSRTAPDISWIHSNYTEDLVRADAVYPMKEFIDGPDGLTQQELDDIYPALIQYASWKGTLYSMPMEATNLGMIYNKDHFREAGLDPERPPRTWEELAEVSKKLLVDKNGDGRYERVGFMVPIVPATGPQGPYMVWQWIPFIWQAGGDIVNEEKTKILFAEPEGVKALTFWKELYEAQNLQNFTNELPTVFISKQASMMLDGPWSLPNYPRLLRGTDWGIAPLPAGPEEQATVVAGEYLAIFKQSAHPEEAWAFVKWVIQPEIQAFWAMKSGYLPVRKSAMEVEEFRRYLEENPAHKAYVDQMEVARAQRQIDYNAVEIERHLATAIERATVGGRDPKQALEEAAAISNRLLQPTSSR